MLAFRALNEEESEVASAFTALASESQRTKCLELYAEALALQASDDLRAAKLRYKQLLRSPFLATSGAGQPQNSGASSGGDAAAQRLRYLCLKNLATINETQGNANAALKYYCKALDIESTDPTVWYHVGCLARRIHHPALARHALERGVSCNRRHWLCLEALLELLWEIGDHASCLKLCQQLLQMDSRHVLASAIMSYISVQAREKGEVFSLAALSERRHRAPTDEKDILALPFKLDSLTWDAIAVLLNIIYKSCSLRGSLSTPVLIEVAPVTAQLEESSYPGALMSVTQNFKNRNSGLLTPEANQPLRKRPRLSSSELLYERRQSTRFKDKSPAPEQDQRRASFTSFLQQWLSNRSESGVKDFRQIVLPTSDTTASHGNPDAEISVPNIPLSEREKAETEAVSSFVYRARENQGIIELIRAFLVWCCIDRPFAVDWSNNHFKERLLSLHQSVLSHSTTLHLACLPAAEIAFDLARSETPITKSGFFRVCQTSLELLLSEIEFLDSLAPVFVLRIYWLQANIAAVRGDLQSTTMYLHVCRRKYQEILVSSEDNKQIHIPYLCVFEKNSSNIIDEGQMKRLEESLQDQVDRAYVIGAFKAQNFQEVIRVLAPRFDDSQTHTKSIAQRDRTQLLGLLVEAYHSCGDHLQALLSGKILLAEISRDIPDRLVDVKHALILLLSCIKYVDPPSLSTAKADLQEILHRIALSAQQHMSSSSSSSLLSRSILHLVLTANIYLLRIEDKSNSPLSNISYLTAAHNQLAQFGACRLEDGTFLRFAMNNLIELLESRKSESTNNRAVRDLLQDSEDQRSALEEDLEEEIEQQIQQCLSCLYGIHLCDSKKLASHPGRSTSFEPQNQQQAADLLRAILPFVKHPSRLNASVKNSAFDALQKVIRHFPLPPSAYQQNKQTALAVLHGERNLLELNTSSISTFDHIDDPWRHVHKNLYYLLARCMRKKDMSENSGAASAGSSSGSREKQLQTAWLLKQDLFVNPGHAASWTSLGDHYAQRLEQILDDIMPWRACQDIAINKCIVKYFSRAERCLKTAATLKPARANSFESLGKLFYTAVRYCRVVPQFWGVRKDELCQNSLSAYQRLHNIRPHWRNLYWMAKLQRKLAVPAEEYFDKFSQGLNLVRTEGKRGGSKAEIRQHEAELLYQLHASRLDELTKSSPNFEAVASYMFDSQKITAYNELNTEEDKRRFLTHDAMTALARPHQIYVYFHKSIYRIAQAYWIKKRVDEAKALMASLFNDRKLSKLCVQIWRVDLDGPGKFEAYRRKYVLLFNELLQATSDVDKLEILVTKLSKDPITSAQHDLMAAIHSSLVDVISRMTKEKEQNRNNTPHIDLTVDSPSSQTAEATRNWLKRSFDAWTNAYSAFSSLSEQDPDCWISRDQIEELQNSASQMLTSSFKLYLHDHPNPDADVWTIAEIQSFCRKTFKSQQLRRKEHENNTPPPTVEVAPRQMEIMDESLDVSQGPPPFMPLTPEIPRPGKHASGRKPKPAVPAISLSPFS